ncbi:MAG: 50S ribosomal protein L11 methyltransferase, partial [Candidatus Paceibacterota bacterium]
QLIELGASGTEQVDQTFKAYFTESQLVRESLEKFLNKFEITNYEFLEVQNENWVAMCEDMFQPVQINNIKIQPIFDYQLREKVPGQIYLIPGMGFGSGHHETSQMLISTLQELPINPKEQLKILDFGTGSGILSLATTEIFPNASILAIDNDAQALLNAKDNLEVNQHQSQVNLSNQDLKEITGQFDIILANIYLEVLKNYQEDLRRLIKPNGYLLISGLTLDQDNAFREDFASWEYLQADSLGNWNSYLLKKS